MADIISYVAGPDGKLIETGARKLCFRGKSYCDSGKDRCKTADDCCFDGWSTFVNDVETILAVVREFEPKEPHA